MSQKLKVPMLLSNTYISLGVTWSIIYYFYCKSTEAQQEDL